MPDQNRSYNSKTITFLKRGLTVFYPEVAKDYFNIQGSLPHLKSWGGFENSLDFAELLFNVTETSSVEEAADWINRYEQGTVERNIPVNIQDLVEQLDEAQAKKASVYEQRQKAKQLERVAQEHREKKTAEYVYLKADKIKPPELDEKTIQDFQSRVVEAKKDPVAYNKKLISLITQDNKIDEATATIIATNLTDKLVSINSSESLPVQLGILYSQNPIHALAGLTNPNDAELIKLIPDEAERLEFCRAAQSLALIQGHDNIIARNLLVKFLGEKLVMTLYPEADNLMPMSVSGQAGGDYYTVQIPHMVEASRRSARVLNNLQPGTESNNLRFANEALAHMPWYAKARRALFGIKIPKSGASINYSSGMTDFFSSKGIPLLSDGLSKMLTNEQFSSLTVSSMLNFRMGTFAFSRAILGEGGQMVGQAFGINLGSFAIRLTSFLGEGGLKIALNVGTKAAVEATTAAAIEASTSTAVTGIGAALGGFLGAAIGWVASVILAKVASWLVEFVKKHKNFFKYLGLAILAAGSYLGLWPLAAFGGLMFLVALGIGGFAVGVGAIVGFGVRSLGFLGSLIVSISTTALIIILSIPMLVALILFIINSGAYIVPPKISTLSSTNPYIDVQKTANPPGPLGSPQTITYTVTITAKKDALTVTGHSNECHATKEKGAAVDCKSLEKISDTDIPKDTVISPGTPFSFTFTSDYDSKYKDSLVTDTFTVSAKSESGGNVSETGTASVCFGKCPTNCFKTVDGNEPWPANFKANLDAAAAALGGSYPNFSAKACANGPVNLCYTTKSPSPVGTAGLCNGAIYARHDHNPSCDIEFNQCGLHSQSDALVMLTHEATHHIQSISGQYEQKFVDQVPQSEWGMCSYGSTNGNSTESMAEGDALFVGTGSWVSCITNYASQYPKHYEFAKKVMFGP